MNDPLTSSSKVDSNSNSKKKDDVPLDINIGFMDEDKPTKKNDNEDPLSNLA